MHGRKRKITAYIYACFKNSYWSKTSSCQSELNSLLLTYILHVFLISFTSTYGHSKPSVNTFVPMGAPTPTLFGNLSKFLKNISSIQQEHSYKLARKHVSRYILKSSYYQFNLGDAQKQIRTKAFQFIRNSSY